MGEMAKYTYAKNSQHASDVWPGINWPGITPTRSQIRTTWVMAQPNYISNATCNHVYELSLYQALQTQLQWLIR